MEAQKLTAAKVLKSQEQSRKSSDEGEDNTTR